MSAGPFIEYMRGRQASLMSTTVTLRRRGAAGTFNETTATWSDPSTSTVYSGPALVRPEPPQLVAAGETSEQVAVFRLKLPVDTAVHLGDVAEVTASTYDAGLVGRFLRVVEVLHDEWQIARVCRAVREEGTPT